MDIRVTEIAWPDPRVLRRFSAHIRRSDAREVLGATGTPRGQIARHLAGEIADALSSGGRVWTVMDGEQPLCLFGARPDSATADTASIWMLATRQAARTPILFARMSRRCLRLVFAAFPQVSACYNWVPARSERTVAWLRWLDAWFSADSRFASPWTGDIFTRFVIEREEARHV